MSNEQIATIISLEFESMSPETIRKIRIDLGFQYKPPIHTFFLTDVQKANRRAFAQQELEHPRDWSRVLFSDETYIWLGDDNRWLWRQPGERGPDVERRTKKHGQKLLVFAAFTSGVQSRIVGVAS
jgi:hypothetical protein